MRQEVTTYVIGGFLDELEFVDIIMFVLRGLHKANDKLTVVDVVNLRLIVVIRPVPHTLVLPIHTQTHTQL